MHEGIAMLDLVRDWVADEELDDMDLDPEKFVKGKVDELQKLMERGVYSYLSRAAALGDRYGKVVKTGWVLAEKGNHVRSRFVAQEFAKGGSAGGVVGRHSACLKRPNPLQVTPLQRWLEHTYVRPQFRKTCFAAPLCCDSAWHGRVRGGV